jgi:GNAT superfamily N-acetyltransferase
MTLPIRTASAADLERMVEWAAREGWNPGLGDAAAFHSADPEGFLLAEDAAGLAGCISAVRHGAAFGFIGFYIVRPDLRGQGVGIALWRAAMRRLEGRVVGLDGVVAQQANYARSGFALAWRNIRYGAEQPRPAGAGVREIVPAAGLPFATLAALDAGVFPAPREAFLRHWLTAPGHQALAVLRQGEVAGFGVRRPCRKGHKIGPLTALDDAAARALFDALVDGVEGPVFLDLPEPNARAVALAEAAGMRPAFETARMYAGTPPAVALERLYGVASFELG